MKKNAKVTLETEKEHFIEKVIIEEKNNKINYKEIKKCQKDKRKSHDIPWYIVAGHLAVYLFIVSSQCNIKNHHYNKSEQKGYRSHIGVIV